jgi:hypothetical protein
MLPAGVPFGVALAAATACVLGFQPRQLLIIPFVLVGWFSAFRSGVWVGLLFGPEVGLFLGLLVAGAIGALITALGISLATRRRLTRHSYYAIILTGALVAEAWFVTMIGTDFCCAMPELLPFYALFSLWQALVALAIGRSIGTLAHGNDARRADISKEPTPPHTGSHVWKCVAATPMLSQNPSLHDDHDRYARVSTNGQTLATRKALLKKAGGRPHRGRERVCRRQAAVIRKTGVRADLAKLVDGYANPLIDWDVGRFIFAPLNNLTSR